MVFRLRLGLVRILRVLLRLLPFTHVVLCSNRSSWSWCCIGAGVVFWAGWLCRGGQWWQGQWPVASGSAWVAVHCLLGCGVPRFYNVASCAGTFLFELLDITRTSCVVLLYLIACPCVLAGHCSTSALLFVPSVFLSYPVHFSLLTTFVLVSLLSFSTPLCVFPLACCVRPNLYPLADRFCHHTSKRSSPFACGCTSSLRPGWSV